MNCSLFYKCDHGKPVWFFCPDGLHFNAVLEVCDWPDQAGCEGGSNSSSRPSRISVSGSTNKISSTDTSSTTSCTPSGRCPAIGICPQHEDGNTFAKHLSHAYNCKKFCKCDHGVPKTFDCPPDTHFNPILEVCDWPENAGCVIGAPSNQPSNSTSDPCNSESTASNPAVTSQTGHPATVAPTSSLKPRTSALSTTHMSLTSPHPSARTLVQAEDCLAVGLCPHHEDENSIAKHLPHAKNCNQFCKCDHGKPVTFNCPAGLHFNPLLEVCDYPYRAGCVNGSTFVQKPRSTSSATSGTGRNTAAPSSTVEITTTLPNPQFLHFHYREFLTHQETVEQWVPVLNTKTRILLRNIYRMQRTVTSSEDVFMENQ